MSLETVKSSKQRVPKQVDRERLIQTLSLQYPDLSATEIMSLEGIRVIYSRKTRRVSYVYLDGEHILSLRTSDGRYLPTFGGACQLLKYGVDGLNILVHTDAVPFVADGRSLYNKHVLEVGSDIRPGSEVFLLSPDQELLATGISMHPGYAMLQLESGIAVKVKHARNKYMQRATK